MLAVLDYGAGNLRSVTRALTQVGCNFEVTSDPKMAASAAGVILPGVGAAADMMAGLTTRGLPDPVKDYVRSGRPYLGVCMGMQVLF
ncbi:MAG: imidazole glycerol phosphate synthase subunit HisH, partial [Gammaproteobacteria bacterium]|nr:imidazole glycerol phosphate synthase subunit HisH [Gammaproteobacteria bacterium]